MSDMEKVKRHLSRPIPITIENSDGIEDTFYFKPLNVEQQAIMVELSRTIQGREKTEVEVEKDGKKVKGKIPQVNKEDIKEMFEVIKDVVKISIPELDDGTLEEFCNSNFNQLSEALWKLMPDNTDKKSLDLIKKRVEATKNAKQNK